MNRANEFSLKNKQKYLKVDILHYAFTQWKIFQFLHKTSRGERNFLIREYPIIKKNSKGKSQQGIGLMTIDVCGDFSTEPRPSCRIEGLAYNYKRTIHLAYYYTIGYQLPPITDFIRVQQSPSHNFHLVDVSVDLLTQKPIVCEIIKLLRSVSSHNQLHGYEPLTLWILIDPERSNIFKVKRLLQELFSCQDMSSIKILYRPLGIYVYQELMFLLRRMKEALSYINEY